MARLDSVNIGRPLPNPYKETGWTGIGKQPISEPVEVRGPGPKTSGLGSGLVGDFIGDGKHHGGDIKRSTPFSVRISTSGSEGSSANSLTGSSARTSQRRALKSTMRGSVSAGGLVRRSFCR